MKIKAFILGAVLLGLSASAYAGMGNGRMSSSGSGGISASQAAGFLDTSANNQTKVGNITAGAFIGDGSGLTGVTSVAISTTGGVTVSTGSGVPVSTTAAVLDFNAAQVNTVKSGATVQFTIRVDSFTALGPTIEATEIQAGALGASVMASSVAANVVSSNTIINGTIGLTDLQSSIVLSSDTTGVTAGTYQYATITVDRNGRIWAASAGTVTGSTFTGVHFNDTGVQFTSITVTGNGSLSVTGGVATLNITGGGGGGAGSLEVRVPGVVASSPTATINFSSNAYSATVSGSSITIIPNYSSGTFVGPTVEATEIQAGALGTSVMSSSIAANVVSSNTIIDGTIGSADVQSSVFLSSTSGGVNGFHLADTAVTPGSYSNASITVDADGRVTSAGNGSNPGADGNVGVQLATQPIDMNGWGILNVASITFTQTGAPMIVTTQAYLALTASNGTTWYIYKTSADWSGYTVKIGSAQFVGSAWSTTTFNGTFSGDGSGLLKISSVAALVVNIQGINATGTPSASTYLRGDGSWSTPAGGGGGGGAERLYISSADSGVNLSTINFNANGTNLLSAAVYTSSTTIGVNPNADISINSLTVNRLTAPTTEYFQALSFIGHGSSTGTIIGSTNVAVSLFNYDGFTSTAGLNFCIAKFLTPRQYVSGSTPTYSAMVERSTGTTSQQSTYVLSFATGGASVNPQSLTYTNPMVIAVTGTTLSTGGERTHTTLTPISGAGIADRLAPGVFLYVRIVRAGGDATDTNNAQSVIEALELGFQCQR